MNFLVTQSSIPKFDGYMVKIQEKIIKIFDVLENQRSSVSLCTGTICHLGVFFYDVLIEKHYMN